MNVSTHQYPRDEPSYDQLRAHLIEEQTHLWADLDHAVRHAVVQPPVVPGHWSIGCAQIADRIVENARLVGAVDWKHIQVGLLLEGIYEKVLHDAGLEWPPVDWDAVRDLYSQIHECSGRTWDGPPADLIGTR